MSNSAGAHCRTSFAISPHPLARRLGLPATLLLSVVSAPTFAADAPAVGLVEMPGPFPERSLDDWQERRFEGSTDYTLIEEAGVRVLRGRADGTASILYRERRVDLQATPIVEWSWKIDGVYDAIDERTRGGDDFPARLYVVARTGLLPWNTLAINYVWASEATQGDSWPNPYTDKAMMIAVRTGSDEAGRWVRERRDVAADFRAAFGERVDAIAGYAVMVDGDDGKRKATAWFGDLAFVPHGDGAP